MNNKEELIIMDTNTTQKYCLTIKEAAAYYGVGEHRLRKLVEEDPTLDWVLHIGTWVKVKRPQFENWLSGQTFL